MSDTDLAFRATLDGSGFASGAQRINGQLQQMGFHTQTATAGLGGIGTMLGTMANPATAAALAVTALGGALVGSAQSAAAWQTSMTGVAKTTGLGGADLAELSDQLLTMSTNMPVAASGLAEIAQAGGSLGIAKEELAGFTEVAAQMGVGFEMSAEQAATAGAKILNAFGQEMDTENLRSLGSVVNAMGDSFAATEPQVLDFLNRASFLNTTMGQSIPQVAALGTTLVSAGMEAEVAATGIKSALNTLTSETSRTGGMTNWAKLMGTDVDTLKEKIASDLNGALIETADKIAAIEDPTERFQKAVQLAGTEGAPALLKLAGSAEDYAKALGMSNEEWKNATSLQKTYDAQMETVTSKWTIFTNTLSMASTELGTVMLPAIGKVLDALTLTTKMAVDFGEGLSGAWDAVARGDVTKDLTQIASGDLLGGVEGLLGFHNEDYMAGGKYAAEQVAEGMKSSDELKAAAAEALDTPEAKAAMAASAKESAQTWVESFGDAAEKGMTALTDKDGNFLGWSSENEIKRAGAEFEYMGKQWEMIYKNNRPEKLFLDGVQVGTVYENMTPAEAFQAITKLPPPREGTSSYFGMMREAGKAELAALNESLKSDQINIADNIFAPEIAIKSKIDELFSAIDSALKDGKLTMGKDSEQTDLLGLVQDLDWLKRYYPEEYAKIGGESTEALNDALRKGDIKKVMEELGKVGGDSFLKALNVSLDEKKVDWGKLFSGDTTGIADMGEFGANVFQPEIINYAKQALDLYNTSLDENRLSAQDLVEAYSELLDIAPELFNDTMIEALNEYTGELESVGPTLQKIVDAAKETKEELKEVFTGQGGGLYSGEFVDPRATWQDFLTPEGGYAGPTELWAERQMEIEERNQQITASLAELESMKHPLEFEATVDTAHALDDITVLEQQIVGTEASITITADTRIAEDRWMNLVNVIQTTPVTVPLTVAVNAYEVQSMVRAAIADAIASA